MQKSFLILISLLSSFALQAQNSFWAKTGLKSNPESFVNTDAYLNTSGNLTTVEHKRSPIPQLEIGFTLKKPESRWGWDLAISYQYVDVLSTVHHDSSAFGFRPTPWEEDYIASLNYFGIHLGSSYTIPFKSGKSQLRIPFGAQILLPFSCKTLQEFGNDTYLFRRIFQGEDYSKGIYYGAYLRPTYVFKLSKDQSSPWNFGIYAEAELLFPNESGRDPSFLGGGGIEIRYSLN